VDVRVGEFGWTVVQRGPSGGHIRRVVGEGVHGHDAGHTGDPQPSQAELVVDPCLRHDGVGVRAGQPRRVERSVELLEVGVSTSGPRPSGAADVDLEDLTPPSEG
jgi:hypothetical protein